MLRESERRLSAGLALPTSGYYLWMHLPGGRFAVQGGVILAIEYTMLLMVAYRRYFLDLPASMPRLNRWVARLAWGLVPGTVVLLLGPYHIMFPLVISQVLLCGGGALAVSLLAWWRGNRVARFYALAWLSFWLLFTITQLQYRAWLPLLILPELQAILGVAIGVTLFFLAMADRAFSAAPPARRFKQYPQTLVCPHRLLPSRIHPASLRPGAGG